MNPFEQIKYTKEDYRGGLSETKPDSSSKASPALTLWKAGLAQENWPKVKQAANCIHGNLYGQQLTVGWMRKQCRISGHNFSTKFAFCLGKKPNQYITYHRVEVAKILLSNNALTGIKLSTIAYELGFSIVSTFSKSFKRETGMPPSQWRE
jgi:AraC-like DNA-binding protein